MGQDYCWINADKKEYMEPISFDLGSRRPQSSRIGNPLLGALYARLDSDWRNYDILFLGDYSFMPEVCQYRILAKIKSQMEPSFQWRTIYIYDWIVDNYKEVSVQFKEAEKVCRDEIKFIIEAEGQITNWYRVDINDPFRGLFTRDPKSFRYTVNETKKEFYDLTARSRSNLDDFHDDPLPFLMAYGSYDTDGDTSRWLDGHVYGSDTKPGPDYRDISRQHFE